MTQEDDRCCVSRAAGNVNAQPEAAPAEPALDNRPLQFQQAANWQGNSVTGPKAAAGPLEPLMYQRKCCGIRQLQSMCLPDIAVADPPTSQESFKQLIKH